MKKWKNKDRYVCIYTGFRRTKGQKAGRKGECGELYKKSILSKG